MGIVAMEAHKERRKEVKKKKTGLHMIKAMGKLSFNNYVGPLTEYLHLYRKATGFV